MLTVKKYGRTRRAHWDGMNIREIARQTHYSPQNLLKPQSSPFITTTANNPEFLYPFSLTIR